MKNVISILIALLCVLFINACNNAITKSNTKYSCNDSCTIRNDYCALDAEHSNGGFEVATADIRIDSFVVTQDGTGHLLLYVHVSNSNDDAAHEARLIILLPTDVCNVSVVNADPQIKSYNQCGGRIEFCLGQMATGGPTSMRFVTIKTDMAKLPQMKGKESFAGFVFSSTPDMCPLNNYRAWVNDNVPCYNSFNPDALVKKGF
jgi:hypothetical protein